MENLVHRAKANWRRVLRRALFSCGRIYLLLCLGCAAFQRRMIYHPSVLSAEKTAVLGRSEELERWKDSTGKAIGWKRLASGLESAGQVLIAHGNADCAFECRDYADAIQQVAPLDVFIVEYPGYADRPGKPSQQSLDACADEALQALGTNKPVYLVGESLGTGVAAYLAGRYPARVAGVAMLAPYNRLTDVAQAHVKILPARWLLCDRFAPEDDLKNYHGPVAVLLAGRDRVVPTRFGHRLYESYTGPKRLWEFPEDTHDSLMDRPTEVWRQIIEFWRQPDG